MDVAQSQGIKRLSGHVRSVWSIAAVQGIYFALDTPGKGGSMWRTGWSPVTKTTPCRDRVLGVLTPPATKAIVAGGNFLRYHESTNDYSRGGY